MNTVRRALFFITVIALLSVSGIGLAAELDNLPNIALGKPTKASSVFTTNAPEFAVDGIVDDHKSRWLTGNNVPPPHWLEIDLDETFTLRGAEVWTGDPRSPGRYPLDQFKLQYWNGSDWQDIPGSQVENNTSDVVRVAFSEPVTASRVRFYSEATPEPVGGYSMIRVTEIKLFGTP